MCTKKALLWRFWKFIHLYMEFARKNNNGEEIDRVEFHIKLPQRLEMETVPEAKVGPRRVSASRPPFSADRNYWNPV